jgi:hypothetical protein
MINSGATSNFPFNSNRHHLSPSESMTDPCTLALQREIAQRMEALQREIDEENHAKEREERERVEREELDRERVKKEKMEREIHERRLAYEASQTTQAGKTGASARTRRGRKSPWRYAARKSRPRGGRRRQRRRYRGTRSSWGESATGAVTRQL